MSRSVILLGATLLVTCSMRAQRLYNKELDDLSVKKLMHLLDIDHGSPLARREKWADQIADPAERKLGVFPECHPFWQTALENCRHAKRGLEPIKLS
jgi:hypothetical protein